MEIETKSVSAQVREMKTGDVLVFPLSFWESVATAKKRARRHHAPVAVKYIMKEKEDGTLMIERVM